MARALPAPPVSVLVFGSFARREAGADSDVDVVVVRPGGIDEDDEGWASSIEQWRTDVRRLTGNPVEVLEVGAEEAKSRLVGQRAAGDDHDQVLVLLRQAGPDGSEVERDLRRLLPLKTKAEYDPDDIAPSVAANAIERAQRCAAVARRVASTVR